MRYLIIFEISHIVEPSRLWLTWQPTDGGLRYTVGQINRLGDNSYQLIYQKESEDFARAKEKGFEGLPSFNISLEKHEENVLSPFLRRLPPKNRDDFKKYLAKHLLPHPFVGSDFALLAYTGAKSPGDGFSLLPDFSENAETIQYQLEIAGTRYQEELDLNNLQIGDIVTFSKEPANTHDPKAIAIFHQSGKLGYVNKVLCDYLSPRLNSVSAVISRFNGTDERPLVYVLLTVDIESTNNKNQ